MAGGRDQPRRHGVRHRRGVVRRLRDLHEVHPHQRNVRRLLAGGGARRDDLVHQLVRSRQPAAQARRQRHREHRPFLDDGCLLTAAPDTGRHHLRRDRHPLRVGPGTVVLRGGQRLPGGRRLGRLDAGPRLAVTRPRLLRLRHASGPQSGDGTVHGQRQRRPRGPRRVRQPVGVRRRRRTGGRSGPRRQRMAGHERGGGSRRPDEGRPRGRRRPRRVGTALAVSRTRVWEARGPHRPRLRMERLHHPRGGGLERRRQRRPRRSGRCRDLVALPGQRTRRDLGAHEDGQRLGRNDRPRGER